MNDVKLVAAFVENKPGQVAHFTKILAGANINIRWLAVASTGPFGVMKFLVSDPEKACEALKHEGSVVKLVDALAIEVPWPIVWLNTTSTSTTRRVSSPTTAPSWSLKFPTTTWPTRSCKKMASACCRKKNCRSSR